MFTLKYLNCSPPASPRADVKTRARVASSRQTFMVRLVRVLVTGSAGGLYIADSGAQLPCLRGGEWWCNWQIMMG